LASNNIDDPPSPPLNHAAAFNFPSGAFVLRKASECPSNGKPIEACIWPQPGALWLTVVLSHGSLCTRVACFCLSLVPGSLQAFLACSVRWPRLKTFIHQHASLGTRGKGPLQGPESSQSNLYQLQANQEIISAHFQPYESLDE
jgi:hypothetical protein